MGLLENLAAIRERQGLPPMPDPTVIQDDGGPPPPPWVPPASPPIPPDWIDTVEDDDVQASYVEPVSPLIPRRAPQSPQAATSSPALARTPDLAVFDRIAAYKGRDVELSEAEHKQVVRIVLGAVARTVNEQLAEVGVKRVRRRKATTAEVLAHVHKVPKGLNPDGTYPKSEGEGLIDATKLKKRGRPKKA